jgi:solute carrier family 25 (peroxisomal adenine nucleotide transporter), member 17
MSSSTAHAISGMLGGMLSLAATYPLLTVSTRKQVETKRAKANGKVSGRFARGLFASVAHIASKEGWSALYSGLKSALVGVSVTQFVYYYWYSKLRLLAAKRLKSGADLPLSVNMLVAAIAGSATALATCPIWVVTTRMQALHKEKSARQRSILRAKKSSGASRQQRLLRDSLDGRHAPLNDFADCDDCVKEDGNGNGNGVDASRSELALTIEEIVEKDGWRGFWRGIGPSLVLVSNPVIQYVLFEKMSTVLRARRSGKRLGALQIFVLGAISKALTTVVTYPYIVLKSRLQVDGRNTPARTLDHRSSIATPPRFVRPSSSDTTTPLPAASAATSKYSSAFDALLKIVKKEGFLALYAGLDSKITQSVLTSALLFSIQASLVRFVQRLLSAK